LFSDKVYIATDKINDNVKDRFYYKGKVKI
jgi:hypothetical protein